ncbi:MAG: glycosyltransferase [Bacteroidota bacterium]
MIYIVYHHRDEALLNRIGVDELRHYAPVQDFIPLLKKRGTVVEVESSGALVESIFQIVNYLDQPVLYLSFSSPSPDYHDLQCPKSIFPNFIPPPLWDRYQGLAQIASSRNIPLPRIATNGNIIDAKLARFQPQSIVRRMPWGRTLAASYLALKKTKWRLALYYLLRRKSVHYCATAILFKGLVYTVLMRSSTKVELWKMLIKTFCKVFAGRSEVTLVIKMVGPVKAADTRAMLRLFHQLSITCRVVIINEHLPQTQYENLIRATSFFINLDAATIGKAVLEFMSAGKPVISPTIENGTLLDQDIAFIVPKLKDETLLLKEPLLQSQDCYNNHHSSYQRMSMGASQCMQQYCSLATVEPQFFQWLDQLEAERCV